MRKLTDTDYILPEIFALEAGPILDAGRTRPNIIRGVCQVTSERGEYVVKFKGSKEMTQYASCKELLAAFIAMELEFNTPAPALIQITPEFLKTMEIKHENYEIASNSLGFNFGNKLEI